MPFSEDIPDPGIEPKSLRLLHWQSSLPLGPLKQNQEAPGMFVSGQGRVLCGWSHPWQAGLGTDPCGGRAVLVRILL